MTRFNVRKPGKTVLGTVDEDRYIDCSSLGTVYLYNVRLSKQPHSQTHAQELGVYLVCYGFRKNEDVFMKGYLTHSLSPFSTFVPPSYPAPPTVLGPPAGPQAYSAGSDAPLPYLFPSSSADSTPLPCTALPLDSD